MRTALLLMALLGQPSERHILAGLSQAVQFGDEEEVRTFKQGSVIEIPLDIPVLPDGVEQRRKFSVTRPANFRIGRKEYDKDGRVIREWIHIWGKVNNPPQTVPVYELECEVFTIAWEKKIFDIEQKTLLFKITGPRPPDPVNPDPVKPDPVNPDPDPVNPPGPVPTDRFDNIGRQVAAKGKELGVRIGKDYARVYKEAADSLSSGDLIWADASDYIPTELKGLHGGTPPEREKYSQLFNAVVRPVWKKHISSEGSVDDIAEILVAISAGFNGI